MPDTNDNLSIQILNEVQSLARDISRLEDRITGADKRFDGIDNRFDKVEQRLEQIEENTSLIPSIIEAIGAHSRDLDNHEGRITELEGLKA